MAITLTSAALKSLKSIMQENNLESGHFVRVSLTSATAEKGVEYGLDIVDEKNSNDRSFTQEGIEVICDPKTYLYAKGLRVDWESNGFAFH